MAKTKKPRGVRTDDLLELSGVSSRSADFGVASVIYAQGDVCTSVMFIKRGTVKLSVVSSAGKEAVVGSGPFKFSNWARSQEIILEANPDHFEPPKMGSWILRDMPNVAAALHRGRPQLARDVGERQQQRPRCVEGTGEVRVVVVADPLAGTPHREHGAHRQERVRRVAREDVRPARAVRGPR